MNQRITLCGLAGVTLLALGSVAVARTWTDSTGQFHVDGELVSNEGGTVTFNRDDGQTVALPFDKLNNDDQKFIEGLKKPAAAANPFVVVPKPAGQARPADLAAKTTQLVNDFHERLSKRINEVDELDTQEKKNAAHEKMVKMFSDELSGKSATLRFPINDVASNGNISELELDWPEGIVGRTDTKSGFGRPAKGGFTKSSNGVEALRTFSAPFSRDEALKIAAGDTLVISGNVSLVVAPGYGGGVYNDRREGKNINVISIWSSLSGHTYTVKMHVNNAKVEHQKK